MSKSINEDDEITIVKNPFFKMFCYNEYQMDIFKTGFIQHFKNILIGNGFEYEEDGEYKQLVKAEKNKIENFTQVIKDKEFNEYVNTALIEFETEEQVDKFEKIQQKYKNLHARIRLLNIGSKEDAIEYKEFLTNEYLLNDYYNFLNLFKTNENIIKKYEERKQETLNIKLINCIYSKILLLKKFEEHYKIKRFQLDFKNVDCKKEINEDFKSLYQNMFPKKNIKLYETTEQLQKIYINLIKMICGELKIITSKRIQKDKKRTHEYNLNKEVISDLIKLCKLNNPELHNYNIKLIEEITGILPDKQN